MGPWSLAGPLARWETPPPVSVESVRQGPLQRAVRLLGVIHPMLFAAAYVLDRFAITNTGIPELWRPLLVGMLVAGALTVLLAAVMRNACAAAMLASAAFLALAFHPIPALVLAGLVLWWMGTSLIRRRRGLAARPLSPGSPVVRATSAYAVVLLVAGIGASLPAFATPTAQPPPLASTGGRDAGPNIYLLLLDGYPRGDTLAEAFDLDMGPFETQLASVGFEVAPQARANHNKTWLTVATMLSAQYVTDLPEIADPPPGAPNQVRLLHDLINDGAVLDVLRGRGYTVRSIPSPVMSTDVTDDAEVWSTQHLNGFEIALVSASAPAFLWPNGVLDLLGADARGLIADQLGAFAATAAQPGPQLVLAHAMTPHPPFVLGGGKLDYLRDCFPACKVWETTLEETGMTVDEYAAHLRSQVGALNDMVVSTLDRIVSDDPEAIVIVMSDHGARLEPDATDEHFRILFAARTPGAETLFTDDQSPVNVFRRILSTTFGEDLPDVPYRAWASDWFVPLDVIERQ